MPQAQLDESSPVAREWALMTVRNLCAGSKEAQRKIEALEVRQPGGEMGQGEVRAVGGAV